MYYEDINLQGNTINIIYQYDKWNISRNRLDNEIIEFGKEYEINNPVLDDMIKYSKETGLYLILIIICELDLDTGIRKIIRGEYVYIQ